MQGKRTTMKWVCALLQCILDFAASSPSSISSAGIVAFAAKKASKSKNKPSASRASTPQGFGARSLTFADVASTFPTRLTDNVWQEPCPCQQGNTDGTVPLLLYQDCCAPYHNGTKLPESPERVLRSRFSAFCFRLVPYIIQTTHPESTEYTNDKIAWAKALDKQGMFDGCTFVALKPLGDTVYSKNGNDDSTEGGDNASANNEAYLNFQVRLQSPSHLNRGQLKETIITENSRFLKLNDTNSWYYVSGTVDKSKP